MKIISGSLLDLTHGMILHQVNCRGVVGGLAGALYRKWPKAFEGYFQQGTGRFSLGEFRMGYVADGLYIGHVFGQLDPGPNTDMKAVKLALESAKETFNNMPSIKLIYAPYKMGCGLGGGDWPTYLEALTKYFPEIIIVKRPEDN